MVAAWWPWVRFPYARFPFASTTTCCACNERHDSCRITVHDTKNLFSQPAFIGHGHEVNTDAVVPDLFRITDPSSGARQPSTSSSSTVWCPQAITDVDISSVIAMDRCDCWQGTCGR